MTDRTEKLQEALRGVVAEFMAREAGRQALITVTRTTLSSDGKRAMVYLTVLPESAENAALGFATRSRSELSTYFKKRVRGAFPPHIEFMIDPGEKLRQRLDELS